MVGLDGDRARALWFSDLLHAGPSRQTYLASAGLAMLAGLAASKLPDRRLAAVVMALVLVHNIGYLWTKKREQFVERAGATAQLIAFAERTHARIYVRCWALPGILEDPRVTLTFDLLLPNA